MSLSPGTLIGPYEIVSQLGAGGMGEVFRARDPRLSRDVAVKVLPPSLTSNPDRLRRFEQEARATGMLNHPNLLTIFDAGTHEGAPYLVSELLEGATLREILAPVGDARRPLPRRKAIDYAIQIANGLAAAHEKGIVHRDLKPDNLFVTNDERVKILDFGLAKLQIDEPGEEEKTAAYSAQQRTGAGVVLGTAGYMAPEQARGESVDHRSDLFALGVVLYEMITGQRAFYRASAVETMAAILQTDPPFDLATPIPPALQRIILHALEKSPTSRFQSARDVAFALSSLSDSSESGSSSQMTTGSRPAPRTRASAPAITYQRLSFRRGMIMSARFAPDGTIYYGAAWEDRPLEIYAFRPGSPDSRPLGIPGADILAVSANNELLLGLNRRYVTGWITTATLARFYPGEAPRELIEGILDAEWDPLGREIAAIVPAHQRHTIEYPLGNRIYESSSWLSHLRFSPSGDLIAFLSHPIWGDDYGNVVVINLAGEPQFSTRTWSSTSGLAWTPSGDEVWVAGEGGRGRDLSAISRSGTVRTALTVPGRVSLHDISADGKALITYDHARREIMFGKRGVPNERNLTWFDYSWLSDLTPNGSKLLFEEQASATKGIYTTYMRGTDGSPAIRLGEGRGREFSHDGKWIAFAGQKETKLELVPTGAGSVRSIRCEGLATIDWWRFLPGDRQLAVLGRMPECGARIFLLDIDGDGTVRPITPEGMVIFAVAPDGKSLVAESPDGDPRIYFIDGSEPVPAPGCVAGEWPIRFSEDGAFLYVASRNRLDAAITRVDLATGEREVWVELRPGDLSGIIDIMPAVITPNGQHYAYGYRRMTADLYVVEGAL